MGALRGYRDRDFVQTPEGLYFCVLGNIHPRKRVIAYLKYVPNEKGKWGRENRYERALKAYTTPSVKETLEVLRACYPRYLYRSRAFGIEFSAVPLGSVKSHLKPETRLSGLLSAGVSQLDELESRAVELVRLLSEAGGVDPAYLGITGSILLGIHNPSFSDIDLVVYGRWNILKVKEALAELYERSILERFTGTFLEEWAIKKAGQSPVSPAEARAIYSRIWGRGFFNGTPFSVHPVKLEGEVGERYGDRIYRFEGLATIQARVVDAEDSYFLPSTYRIDDVKVLQGSKAADDILEATTYDGFYGGLFRGGERLVARGKLERVMNRREKASYHRLLVGSFEAEGRDYIKPLLEDGGEHT